MKNSKQGHHSPQIRDSSFSTAWYTEVVAQAAQPAWLTFLLSAIMDSRPIPL